jgi:hypothetical protein
MSLPPSRTDVCRTTIRQASLVNRPMGRRYSPKNTTVLSPVFSFAYLFLFFFRYLMSFLLLIIYSFSFAKIVFLLLLIFSLFFC